MKTLVVKVALDTREQRPFIVISFWYGKVSCKRREITDPLTFLQGTV